MRQLKSNFYLKVFYLRVLTGLLFCSLIFGSLALAQESSRTFRIPFHTVNNMILLDATVNGKPASLLLDTGADATILSPQASGLSTVKLRALTATKTTGANGEYVKSRVDLRLAERHWIEREILVMDLSDASKRMGTRIDGFLGQDILREFSSVRIDFKNQVLELESGNEQHGKRQFNTRTKIYIGNGPSFSRVRDDLPRLSGAYR